MMKKLIKCKFKNFLCLICKCILCKYHNLFTFYIIFVFFIGMLMKLFEVHSLMVRLICQ